MSHAIAKPLAKSPVRKARPVTAGIKPGTSAGTSAGSKPSRLARRPGATAASADTALFSRIVSGKPLAGLEAIAAIREGYSARILKAASSFFDVPDARIQLIAQVPASTASRLEKKEARIDPAATERVFRMGTVTRMAIEVFEDEAAAIAWMRQPNRTFGDVAPLDLMDTEPGAIAVRQVLSAIATGGLA